MIFNNLKASQIIDESEEDDTVSDDLTDKVNKEEGQNSMLTKAIFELSNNNEETMCTLTGTQITTSIPHKVSLSKLLMMDLPDNSLITAEKSIYREEENKLDGTLKSNGKNGDVTNGLLGDDTMTRTVSKSTIFLTFRTRKIVFRDVPCILLVLSDMTALVQLQEE